MEYHKIRRMMKPTNKQLILIRYVQNNGFVTTKIANELLRLFYYSNHEHYVSEILARLVKANVFKRVKIGVYELSSGIKKIGVEIDNQETLF